MPQKREALEDRLLRFRTHVGEWLRSARAGRAWSARDLAAKSGVSASEILRIEKAERECRLESLIQLADALGWPPALVIDELLHFASRTNEFSVAVANDPEFVVLAERFGVTGHRRDLFAGIVSDWCNEADILSRSASAYRECVRAIPYCETMREPILRFAERWDLCDSAMERIAFWEELWRKPVKTLRRQGLLPDSALEEAVSYLDANVPDVNVLLAQLREKNSVKLGLTSFGSREKVHGDMQKSPEWLRLRAELKRTTSRRGEKSKLARLLGVSRQAVFEWVNGSNAPTAGTLLRLQVWLSKRATVETKDRSSRSQ